MLVHSENADLDREFLREEAEAEREPLLLMEATEIKHRYAMETETLWQLIVKSAGITLTWELLAKW